MSVLSEATAEIKAAIVAEREQVKAAIAKLEEKIDSLVAGQITEEDLAGLKGLVAEVGAIYEDGGEFAPE